MFVRLVRSIELSSINHATASPLNDCSDPCLALRRYVALIDPYWQTPDLIGYPLLQAAWSQPLSAGYLTPSLKQKS